MYANCLIYISSVYCELLHFQFFNRGDTYSYSDPISRSKCTRKSPKKRLSHFAKKCCFYSFFFEMKVTCMPITYLIFWPFTVNSLLFSYFTSQHWFKKSTLAAKNVVIFCWKTCFLILLSDMKVNCMSIGCFIFSNFAINTFFFSSLVVAYVCRFQS